MNEKELKARYDIVEKLVKLFKFERMIHLVVTTISLLILLSSVSFMIIKGQADSAELTLMFGSSGLITYAVGRLLKMWDQALKAIVTGEMDK